VPRHDHEVTDRYALDSSADLQHLRHALVSDREVRAQRHEAVHDPTVQVARRRGDWTHNRFERGADDEVLDLAPDKFSYLFEPQCTHPGLPFWFSC